MPSSRWGIHLCLFLRAFQILQLLHRKTVGGYYITPGSHFSLLSWSCNETGVIAYSSNWICFGGSAFQQPYHFIRAAHSHLGTTHSLLPSVNVYLCSWRWNVFPRRTGRNIINHSHACFCWFLWVFFFLSSTKSWYPFLCFSLRKCWNGWFLSTRRLNQTPNDK